MIAAFEKVVWIVTVVAIAAVGGAYAYLGGPSMTPAIERSAKDVDVKDIMKNADDADKDIINKPAVTPLGKDGSKKSKRSGRGKAKTVARQLNKATLEGINNFNRAFKEAKKLKSEVTDEGLKIFDFGPSSIASTIGFEENDVILGINGEALDWESLSGTKSLVPGSDAHKLYEGFLEQAESGGVIRIDIKRRGTPMKILFTVD